MSNDNLRVFVERIAYKISHDSLGDIDLSSLAKKTDLAPYAKKTELDIYALKTDLDEIDLSEYAKNSTLLQYVQKTIYEAFKAETEQKLDVLDALVKALQTGTSDTLNHPVVFLPESAIDNLTASNTQENYIYMGLEIEGGNSSIEISNGYAILDGIEFTDGYAVGNFSFSNGMVNI